MLWPREEFLNLVSDCLFRTYVPVSSLTFLLNLFQIQATSSHLLCPLPAPTNFDQPPGDKPGSKEGPSAFSDDSQSKLKCAILNPESSFQASPWLLSSPLLRLEKEEISNSWRGGSSSSHPQGQSSSSCAPQLSDAPLKLHLSASVKTLFIPPQFQQKKGQRIATGLKKGNTKCLLNR